MRSAVKFSKNKKTNNTRILKAYNREDAFQGPFSGSLRFLDYGKSKR